jgi:hypothetical protein
VGAWFGLHAGLQWDRGGADWIEAQGLGSVGPAPAKVKGKWESTAEHPIGIFAIAKFDGNVTESSDPWFMGQYGWLLDEVILIDPIPCRGAQKLWEVSIDTQEAVNHAVSKAIQSKNGSIPENKRPPSLGDGGFASIDVGDFVHVHSPNPSRADLPIYGTVRQMLSNGTVLLDRCHSDGSPSYNLTPGSDPDKQPGGHLIQNSDFALPGTYQLMWKARPKPGKLDLVNLKEFNSSSKRRLVAAPDFFYIGRQYDEFLESPLANPYAIRGKYSREEACSLFEGQQLRPALALRRGPVWDSVSMLAEKILNGQDVTLGCWCVPQQCHGHSIIQGVEQVVKERANGRG